MKKVFSAIALCVVASTSFAWTLDRWEPVHMNGDFESTPWDMALIEKRPLSMDRYGRVTAWTLWAYSFDPSRTINTKNGRETYQSITSLTIYNCIQKSYGYLNTNFYKDANGETFLTSQSSPNPALEPVVPESVGDLLLSKACALARKNK